MDETSPAHETIEDLLTKGAAASLNNRLDEAQTYIQQAIHRCRAEKDLRSLANSYYALARDVLVLRGEFTAALDLLSAVTSFDEELGQKHLLAYLLRVQIYHLRGQVQECLDQLNQIPPAPSDQFFLRAGYFLAWATVSLDEENLERAKESLKAANQNARQIDNHHLHPVIFLEYCRLFRLQNNPPDAISYATSLINDPVEKCGYYIGHAFLERAQAKRQLQDAAGAYEDLQQAVQILSLLPANYLIALALFLKAIWEKQDNDPDSDQSWIKAYVAVKRGGFFYILQTLQEDVFPLIASHLRNSNREARAAAEEMVEKITLIPAPPLTIQTFGQFVVWKGHSLIPDKSWTKRRAGELFRFLLLQPNFSASKDTVLEALWPDNAAGNSESLLQATSTIRHILEPDLPQKFPSRYIRFEEDFLSLQIPPGSSIDFLQFETQIQPLLENTQSDRIKEVLKIYRGPLFPEDYYNSWSAEKREFLQDLYVLGKTFLAKMYLEENDTFQAIRTAEEAFKLDPWNEEAVLIGMKAFVRLDNVPRAVNLYRALSERLKADLSIEPRKDLQELVRSISQR